jgi:hypothetical protein
MRLTVSDGFSTAFVAAAAAMYVPWATGAAFQGTSARVIAAAVFALGWAACVADQRQMAVVYGVSRDGQQPPIAYAAFVSAVGALALVAGLIAIVTASAATLAVLAASIAALWLVATARHVFASGSAASGRRLARPA